MALDWLSGMFATADASAQSGARERARHQGLQQRVCVAAHHTGLAGRATAGRELVRAHHTRC